MFFEALQRHLAVCARADLPRMAKFDPGFWNVVSMRGPTQPAIDRRGFKQIHQVLCYDVTGGVGSNTDDTHGVPRKEHVRGIFQFVDSIPGEPLLVHCMMGVSRSTAVALALIVRSMHADGLETVEIARRAPEILLAIRPQAAPNPLILELGISDFIPATDASLLVRQLLGGP